MQKKTLHPEARRNLVGKEGVRPPSRYCAHESPHENGVGGGFGARGRSPQGRPQRSH